MQKLSLRDYQRYLNPFLVLFAFLLVFLADNRALIIVPVALLVHWFYSYPGELRYIAQVLVIGWLFNAIVFRSELVGQGQSAPLYLLLFWFAMAIGICHSIKPALRPFRWVPLIGGVIINSFYTTVLYFNDVDLYADHLLYVITSFIIWALAFTLIVFIANTRVLLLPE